MLKYVRFFVWIAAVAMIVMMLAVAGVANR
jgi:hypothetical protein